MSRNRPVETGCKNSLCQKDRQSQPQASKITNIMTDIHTDRYLNTYSVIHANFQMKILMIQPVS